MDWRIDYTPKALKQLKKLDQSTAEQILLWLDRLLKECPDPTQRGHGLTGNMAGLWRYRVGDYRVVCELQDGELLVLVVRIAHRSEVYKRR